MTGVGAAIKVNATSRLGRTQRAVLAALQSGETRTTAQLAEATYGRVDVFEQNSVLRAIRQLTARGFSFSKTRKGRPNATGYVYEWSLAE